MQKQIKAQIDRIVSEGAIYADARWYPVEEEEYLAMWNGNLKSASASRESGIGSGSTKVPGFFSLFDSEQPAGSV